MQMAVPEIASLNAGCFVSLSGRVMPKQVGESRKEKEVE
jgi:hypothetical protein